MKNLLVLILLTCNVSLASADTIDFYHVYYNDIKIAEFNVYDKDDSSSIIQLDLNKIEAGDQLIIKYYMDFIMPESTESVFITDQEKNVILTSTSVGREHRIDLFKLIQVSQKFEDAMFPVTHQFTDYDRINFLSTLFYLKLDN